MKVTFFWKCSKFDPDFGNPIKLGEDVHGFENNCVRSEIILGVLVLVTLK